MDYEQKALALMPERLHWQMKSTSDVVRDIQERRCVVHRFFDFWILQSTLQA